MEKAKKALIIVDVQNDFCPNGLLPVPNGDKIVPVINTLIRKFIKTYSFTNSQKSKVLYTKDLHIDDHDGFPLHCIRGTQGAKFHPDLIIVNNLVFGKGLKSHESAFSGFQGLLLNPETDLPFGFGNDVSLGDWLNVLNVKRVFITGLATDYCVRATALDAQKAGFETFVIIDACRGVNKENSDAAVEEMKAAKIKIISSDEI